VTSAFYTDNVFDVLDIFASQRDDYIFDFRLGNCVKKLKEEGVFFKRRHGVKMGEMDLGASFMISSIEQIKAGLIAN
jgi:hypothetical protein